MEPSSTEGGAEETLLKNHPPSPPHKVMLKHGQELEEEQEELAEHQPLEQEDLNFERWKRRPLPKRTLHQKIDDVKTYLWNAETNEFMGRSGKSWSLILLFYAALYLFLAAMFGGCMFCLMWSISPYHPTLNDRVMPPGLSLAWHCCGKDLFMPFLSHSPSLPPCPLSPGSSFAAYNDGTQEKRNIRCTQDRYFMQDDLEESAERKACQFKRSWLGDCSGMQDPHYGYSQGRPCVLLRMNRILGYLPGQGKPVNVTCGVKKGPPEAVGELQFFPKSIFDLKYYPYYGKQRHVNYSSPVVAVRFAGVQYDTHIQVQCKLNGEGIINNSPTDRYQGSVTFSLEVGA
uniref:Sodium/potassium-transporting ATPase subunit beta n=1 Tax=Scophthalmus maximus TaxID=52904 RepID=A0A8D3EDL7_SCOMX